MIKRTLQYTVIILGILILISFFAIIYGMYAKISTNSADNQFKDKIFSMNLDKNDKIIDIKVIDEKKLLIIIQNSQIIKGAIYDIKANKIIKIIEK